MAASRSLPVATSGLVGRSEQVAALRSMLSSGASSRLVTLTGPPGVGKTRLALEIASTVAGGFADGVAWVDLGLIRDSKQVPGELANALGGAPGMAFDSVLAGFADQEVLLVVDNCEHVLDGAWAIGAVLDAMPRARVLATSRHRLHLLAEIESPVPPLPLPTEAQVDDVAGLARNPAVELLLARSPAHVTLTRRTAGPLVEVCLRLDGLPLALELAAARLRIFTPSELAFRLEHRTVGLSGAPRDAPARHRTLISAIEWSHDLLPDAERLVFRRLALLVGGWTLAAAQAVCGVSEAVVLAAIEVLVEQSLLQRVPIEGSARFVMLASLRDYAEGQLTAAGELVATRNRHAEYFAGVGSAWEATIGTDAENATWAEFEAVHADLSAAFAHVGPGQVQAWLGVALAWYGHIHGSLEQAPAVLEAIRNIESLATCEGVSADLDADDRSAMMIAAGVIGLGIGELIQADQDLRTALGLSAIRGDGRRQAIALSFLGHVARGLGHPSEAAQHYRSARAICQRRGNIRGTAWSAYDLGLLAVDQDDPADRAVAEQLLREALTYFDDLGYDWAVAQSAWGLAVALLDRDVDEAGRLLGRSLVLHERVGDRRGSAQCLEALAAVAADRGSLSSAARLIGSAQTQRRLGVTMPTEHQAHRLEAVQAKIVATLGRVAADHEYHNGRTAPRGAALEFAVGIANPEPVPTAVVALTTRQRQVAALVAGGNTNRQIGRALGISEKTAEIHVSNIMARLAVPSRAAVAAWAAAQSAPVG